MPSIFYTTNPVKKPKDSHDRVDIMYVCGHALNPKLTYLDAWLAERRISNRFWLWPNTNMEVVIDKDVTDPNKNRQILKPKDFTIQIPNTRFEKGMFRPVKETALIFKPGNIDEGKGEAEIGMYIRQKYFDLTIETTEQATKEINDAIRELSTNQETLALPMVPKEPAITDYSIRLKRVQIALQREEFERNFINKAWAKIGKLWEESSIGRMRGWTSTWKLPKTAQKINQIIENFLIKAEKDGNRVLNEKDFNQISAQIHTIIEARTSWLGLKSTGEEADPVTKKEILYSDILNAIDGKAAINSPDAPTETVAVHVQHNYK